MGYRVYFKDLFRVENDIKDYMSIWEQHREFADSSLKNFHDSDSFRGKKASSIKEYINDVHGDICSLLEQVIKEFNSAVSAYCQGYPDATGGNNGANMKGDHGEGMGYVYTTLLESELCSRGTVELKLDAIISSNEYLNNTVRNVVNEVLNNVSNTYGRLHNLFVNNVTVLNNSNQVSKSLLLQWHTEDLISFVNNCDTAVKNYEAMFEGALSNSRAVLGEAKNIINYQLGENRMAVENYSHDTYRAAFSEGTIESLKKQSESNTEIFNQMTDSYSVRTDYDAIIAEEAKIERDEKMKWLKVGVAVIAAVGSAVAIAATGGAAAVVICAGIGVLKGAADTVIDEYTDKGSAAFNGNFDIKKLGVNCVVGGLTGAITGAIGGSASTSTLSFFGKVAEDSVVGMGKGVIKSLGDVAYDAMSGKDIGQAFSDKFSMAEMGKNVIKSTTSALVGNAFDLGLDNIDNSGIKDYIAKPLGDVVEGSLSRGTGEVTYQLLSNGDVDWNKVKDEAFSPTEMAEDFLSSEGKALGKDRMSDDDKFRGKLRKGGGVDKDGNVVVYTFEGNGKVGVTEADYNEAKAISDETGESVNSLLGVRTSLTGDKDLDADKITEHKININEKDKNGNYTYKNKISEDKSYDGPAEATKIRLK